MTKKPILLIIFIIVIILGTVLWMRQANRRVLEKQPIKIGAILPLTGGAAHIGESYKKGIELAVREANASGGVNGTIVKVIYEDSQNNAKEGIKLFEKLVNFDKVQAVLVAMSGVTLPLVSLTDQAKVVVMTFAAHPEAVRDYPYVFRHQINSRTQAQAISQLIFNDLGLTKIDILYLNDEYVSNLAFLFKRLFEDTGGHLSVIEYFNKGDTDFKTQILKIQQDKPEGIYIPGYDTTTGLVIKQLRELGVNIPIFGSFGFDYPAGVAKEAAEGAYYTEVRFNPQSKDLLIKKFMANYRNIYGNENIDIANTPMAYDATQILIKAFKSGAKNGSKIRDYILSHKEFKGVTGLTIYDDYGDSEKEVIIKIVKNGQLVPYKKTGK